MANNDSDDILLPGASGDDVYRGGKEKCDHCGKEFTWGELILVSSDTKLVFCCRMEKPEEIGDIGCMLRWVIANGKTLFLHGDEISGRMSVGSRLLNKQVSRPRKIGGGSICRLDSRRQNKGNMISFPNIWLKKRNQNSRKKKLKTTITEMWFCGSIK